MAVDVPAYSKGRAAGGCKVPWCILYQECKCHALHPPCLWMQACLQERATSQASPDTWQCCASREMSLHCLDFLPPFSVINVPELLQNLAISKANIYIYKGRRIYWELFLSLLPRQAGGGLCLAMAARLLPVWPSPPSCVWQPFSMASLWAGYGLHRQAVSSGRLLAAEETEKLLVDTNTALACQLALLTAKGKSGLGAPAPAVQTLAVVLRCWPQGAGLCCPCPCSGLLVGTLNSLLSLSVVFKWFSLWPSKPLRARGFVKILLLPGFVWSRSTSVWVAHSMSAPSPGQDLQVCWSGRFPPVFSQAVTQLCLSFREFSLGWRVGQLLSGIYMCKCNPYQFPLQLQEFLPGVAVRTTLSLCAGAFHQESSSAKEPQRFLRDSTALRKILGASMAFLLGSLWCRAQGKEKAQGHRLPVSGWPVKPKGDSELWQELSKAFSGLQVLWDWEIT